MTLARAIVMKCWEQKLLPRDAEGQWEVCNHPSKKRSDCRRVKGDGYLSKKKTKKQKKQDLVFSATKQSKWKSMQQTLPLLF